MIATNLPARVARTIRANNLFNPGDTIIVALSGGADSCALLDIMAGLEGLKARLVVAHLNHCLRGTESDADEAFARTMAGRYALPFESRRLDVRLFANQKKLNLEDAGRRARMTFLEEIRLAWKAKAVALAHHADDQAETVLMRLLRGSGMTGLSGMSHRNGHHRIRPLLDVTRTEIEAYLTAREISHREDASNRDITFLRNRIRHELLPLLEHYNPAIRERLTTTAALLSDENNLLDQLTEELATRACRYDGSSVSCHLALLADQHPSLKRRVFLHALEQLAGNREHFSRRHIAALESLADAPRPNAAIILPQKITARREYDRLVLHCAEEAEQERFTGTITIDAPGNYLLPDGARLSLTVETAPVDTAALARETACFDADRAPFPWQVRMFVNGDRMTPLGMTGSKKLKDIFIDAKIPQTRRRRIPLIFCGEKLIWITGLRTSAHARIDATSTRIIRAEYCEKQG